MNGLPETTKSITNDTSLTLWGVVGGVDGLPKEQTRKKSRRFIWRVERGARWNYRRLGRYLASRRKNLFRNGAGGHGLLQVLVDGTVRLIRYGAQVTPILVDTVTIQVEKDGKIVADLPAAVHLNAMLKAECFLGQFRSVDRVSRLPIYQADFLLAPPGHHQDGEGRWLLSVGPLPKLANGVATITRFLDAMAFAGPADRTNALAAAVTVRLRHRWPGEKPIVVITGSKSHSGKSTVTDFVKGAVPSADLLYEANDWPLQVQFQRQIATNPDVGIAVLDNARRDSAGGKSAFIRSAFVESFVTTAELTMAAPGAGEPIRLRNEFVVAINTNDGMLSPDLLNRALPIHLAPKGNVFDQASPIGNPKLEFLPAHREEIEAELHGMIARWQQAGCPLDESVKHPMTPWARTVGGILKFHGFTDFLANYGAAKLIHDPIREALGMLAAAQPGQELKPMQWAKQVVELGLAKTLIPATERDTDKGRERALGSILHKHLGETFEGVTEAQKFQVRLEGGYRRWQGRKPHTRYVFTVLSETPVPLDA